MNKILLSAVTFFTMTGSFTHAQNVGIGTTDPKEKLDIAKAITFHTGGTIGLGFNWHYNGGDRFSGYAGGAAHCGKFLFGAGGDLGYFVSTGAGAENATATMNSILSLRQNGRVGLGTSTPNSRLSISPDITESKVSLWDGGGTTDHYGFGVSAGRLNYEVNGTTSDHVFLAGGKNGTGSELMRITGSGNVGIGLPNPLVKLVVRTAGPTYTTMIKNEGNSTFADCLSLTAGTNSTPGAWFIGFHSPNGNPIGSIVQATATTVAYNTNSDGRLKKAIQPTLTGLQALMKIRVLDYSYTADPLNTMHTGMIAQELYEVFPGAVTKGTDDVSKRPWAIDYGKLTPLLIKAVQEQQMQIDQLKKENETLKVQQGDYTKLLSQVEELRQAVELVKASGK